MSETLDVLISDLLSWLAAGPKPYAEVMEAWRTSCPRLPIWEEALSAGLIKRRAASERTVELTNAGRDWLQRRRSAEA